MAWPKIEPDDAMPPASSCDDIRRLVDYWRSIHPAEGLPGRQHFDPMQIPALLSHIWLTDAFRDPWRFRMRLIGTAIVNFTGRDVTGRWGHDVYDDFEQTEAFRQLVFCAEHRQPVFRIAPLLSNPSRHYQRAQRVHLPLAADGRNTDMILSMTRYVASAPP